MLEDAHPYLDQIAEAIADGQPLDWDSAEESASDATEREAIRGLRGIAQIADLLAGLSSGESVLASFPSLGPITEGDAESVLTSWGPLLIREKVGRGRFGTVYRAFDPSLDREVALKLLRRPDRAIDDESQVVSEGRLMARVRHPNVVSIFGAQRIDGRTGLWMEFVHGRTLEAELRERGPFTPDEIVRIGIDLCRALAAVHSAGFVHRDVKAQNVLRDADGRVVLGDFGTGLEIEEDPMAPAAIAGTPVYLPPEVLARRHATTHSDLYSLGVLLFHLATGRYPVEGRSLAELRAAHAAGRRTSLRKLRPDLPTKLAEVVERALEADPSARFENAAAMEIALAATAPKAVHRASRLTQAALVLVALAVGALAVVTWRAGPDSTPSGVTVSRVDVGPFESVTFWGPASDRRLACTPAGNTGVALCDLARGTVQRVRGASLQLEWAADARPSPDGNLIAYVLAHDTRENRGTSVRLIGADGTGDRELYRADAGATLTLERWIHSGQALLVAVRKAGEEVPLRLVVPTDGGSSTPWPFEHPADGGFDMSPDERFIVFSRLVPGTDTADLAILDTTTGQERWLLSHPGDDESPIWLPDGSGIAFLGNRLGGTGLYLLPMRNDTPQGDPARLTDWGRGSVRPLGVTDNGTLYVEVVPHWVEAYRAELDLDAGTLGEPVRLDPRSSEDTTSPQWSPDGRRFAYLSGHIGGARPGNARVVVREANGSPARELQLDGPLQVSSLLRWSPDGRRLAVTHPPSSGPGTRIAILDIDTGESRTVAAVEDVEAIVSPSLAWAPAGDALFYSDPAARGDTVWRLDLTSGERRRIHAVSKLPGFTALDVSRDGTLALIEGGSILQLGASAGPAGSIAVGCKLNVMSPDIRVVHEVDVSERCLGLRWSRDGTRLLFGAFKALGPPRLNILDLDGAAPRSLDVPTEKIRDFSLAPTGRTLLFSAGSPTPEVLRITGLTGGASDAVESQASEEFNRNVSLANEAFGKGALALAQSYADKATAAATSAVRDRSIDALSWPDLFDLRLAWLDGDAAEVLRLADHLNALAATRPEGGYFLAGWVYLSLGRLDQAEEAASRVRADPGSMSSSILDQIRYAVLATRADPEQTRQALTDRPTTGARAEVAWAWLEAGFLEEAEADVQNLAPEGPVPLFVQGEVTRRRGRAQEAIGSLLEGLLRPSSLGVPLPWTLSTYQLQARSLALAHEELGDVQTAIDVLETATAERRAFEATHGSTHLWMRSLGELSRLYRRVGRVPEAVEIEDYLLQRLALADKDHPLLVALQRQRQGPTQPTPPAGR